MVPSTRTSHSSPATRVLPAKVSLKGRAPGIGNIGRQQAPRGQRLRIQAHLQLRVPLTDGDDLVHPVKALDVLARDARLAAQASSSAWPVTTTRAVGKPDEVVTSRTKGSSASSGNSSLALV